MRTRTYDAAANRRKAGGAAMALWAGAAGCAVEALRTHLWLSSLGPICGLDRPSLFFLHCPACPAALALAAAATAVTAFALRAPAPVAARAQRSVRRT